MKKYNINKILVAIGFVGMAIVIPSCVKDRNPGAPDFSTIKPSVSIISASVTTNGSGLANFSRAALLFPATDVSDTIFFRVNYAATNVAPADVVVKLAVDATALANYNTANPNPANPYTVFPDSIYSFKTTSVTIKKGQTYSDPIPVVVYPNKVNSSKNYMLPISITDGGGNIVSGDFGTIYYHFIGNPLAGKYQDYGQRFNYTGSVPWTGPTGSVDLATAPGTPSSNPPAGGSVAATYNSITTFAPVDGQTVTGTMGNVPDPSGGSAYYLVTANASFSAITYDFASTWYGGYSNTDRFVRGYLPPSPTQKPAFRLVTHYNNAAGGAGNDRIIDETFRHL